MISKRIYWIFYWGKHGIALLCRYWIFFLFLLLCTIKMIANRNTSLFPAKSTSGMTRELAT
jgi:hypothetical protein